MKTFLVKTTLFAFVIIAILCMALFWITNQTVSEDSQVGAIPDRHTILINTPSPKIVFVGGSNLSFGLDSSRIVEELRMPVVDTGINGGIGLRYMMNDVLPYVKKNDIVVLVPEYSNFYTPVYYGNIELVSILFDVFPQGKQFISIQQWLYLAPYMFRYAVDKIEHIPSNLINKFNPKPKPKTKTIDVYHRYSFNKFGDAYIHWNKASEIVSCANKSSGKETVNASVLSEIKEFKNNLQKKDAKLIILPPAYQECSFNNQEYIINQIATQLNENNLAYLTSPLRYRFSDNLIYNTTYHLNKQGVDLRTGRVIEDLRMQIRK
jgi:hypothetical protein